MALLEKHLVVKESTIPGSGNGLFTNIFIKKGTRVLEYKGRITTWKEVENDSNNPYIYCLNPDHVIDAKRTKKSLGRYANDARGLSRITGLTNNCNFINEGLRVFIDAIKDIPAGGEILVGYGKEYWDVIRKNKKTEEREKRQNSRKASGKTPM